MGQIRRIDLNVQSKRYPRWRQTVRYVLMALLEWRPRFIDRAARAVYIYRCRWRINI